MMPAAPVPIKDTATKAADSLAQGLFEGSPLQVHSVEPSIHFTTYDYTIAGMLFIGFVLIVWLYVSHRKRLGQVVRAFYISRYANQLSRDEVSVSSRVSVFLTILFVIVISLFMLQVNRYYNFYPVGEGPLAFGTVALSIVLVYLGKVILIRFLGFVFQTVKEAGDYVLSLFLFGNTLGLFLMPVVVCLAFARQFPQSVFVYSGFGIIVLFLTARLVRAVIIGLNSSRVSAFYLFLYLCTLEILPFIVLIKLFKVN
jgi:hypothetical protein